MGVARYEGVSGADDAAHYIPPVPGFGCPFEHVANVEVLGDEVADFLVFVPLRFELTEAVFHFFVEKVAHLFQHRDGVCLLFGVLSQADQDVEQFVDVGEVEVSSEREGPTSPVVLAQEWVYALNGVSAIGAVAQVTQEDLSSKGEFFLQPLGVFQAFWVVLLCIGKTPHDLREQVFNGLFGDRAGTAQIAVARRNVELNVGQSHPVLTAVALFLHQEVHLVQAVKGRPIMVDVVLKRLFEPEQGYATLVLEEVTHRGAGGSRAAKVERRRWN